MKSQKDRSEVKGQGNRPVLTPAENPRGAHLQPLKAIHPALKRSGRVGVQTRNGQAAWPVKRQTDRPRGGSRAAFRPGDAPYDIIGFDCRLGAAFTNDLATSQGAAPVGSPPFARKKPAEQARRLQ